MLRRGSIHLVGGWSRHPDRPSRTRRSHIPGLGEPQSQPPFSIIELLATRGACAVALVAYGGVAAHFQRPVDAERLSAGESNRGEFTSSAPLSMVEPAAAQSARCGVETLAPGAWSHSAWTAVQGATRESLRTA